MAADTQVAAIFVMLCGAVRSCVAVVKRSNRPQGAIRYTSSPKSVAEEQSVMHTVA